MHARTRGSVGVRAKCITTVWHRRPYDGMASRAAPSRVLRMGVSVTAPCDHGLEHAAALPVDHSCGRSGGPIPLLD